MSKRPFIRAIEIWAPSDDPRILTLKDGYYSNLKAFETISKEYSFAYNEGLPGRAWSTHQPIILKDLVNSFFKRGEEAVSESLTCAMAIPVFEGHDIKAVLVLFCGEDEEHIGAIELWHKDAEEKEMRLSDGYFGTADMFEFQSRHVHFRCGFGLPGMVWDTGLPYIMKDLSQDQRFVRSASAEKSGISRGLGIPYQINSDFRVFTLLSAMETPIAVRFEVWTVDADTSKLTFDSAICERTPDLEKTYKGLTLTGDDGTLGHAMTTFEPALCKDFKNEPEPLQSSIKNADLSLMVALPVILHSSLKAVVAWYL